MRRKTTFAVASVIGGAAFVTMTGNPAGAAIHEMVAAYCSGGGHGAIDANGALEPPGITDFTRSNFAAPVAHNGVVDLTTLTVTDHPAAKFPEGTSVFAADVGTTAPDHASANCNALSD